jgi:hypothetical protein
VKVSLGLSNGKPCVVLGITLIARPILNNLLDDFFGFVASREGALGEGPVVFGLAQMGPRRGFAFGAVVVYIRA